MIIKTRFKNNRDLNLMWSSAFLMVLLLSNKVTKCQLDSDDSDEVGGSLLSLAAPSTSSNNANPVNNLFTNPIQEKLNNMDAVGKLAEQNEQAKLVINYKEPDTKTSSNNDSSSNNASTPSPTPEPTSKPTDTNDSNPSPAPSTTNSNTTVVPNNTSNDNNTNTTTTNVPSAQTTDKTKSFLSKARSSRVSSSVVTPQSTVTVNINGTNIHNPYGKETFEMRNISIIFIECYGIIFLLAKMLLACFNNKKSFFTKLVKSLLKQSHFFFFFLVVVYIVYIFGAVDKVKNNWEYFLGGIGILGLLWMMVNIFIIIFSTMVIKKWDELEKHAKSFSYLKEKLEHQANDIEAQDKKAVSFLHQCYEHLTLKIYFSIPLFPIFKKMTLRREFNFAQYLKFCLSEKLRHLFKFSWTCWIIAMFWLIFWHVVVAPLNLTIRIYIMLPLPVLGLLITFFIYAYMIAQYRRVVVPAENIDLKDYNDILVYHQIIWDKNPNFIEPLYIQEIKWDEQNIGLSWLNKNINLMIHNNYPSLYEENMFMGSTGYNVFLNIIQCNLFLFTAWSTLIFSKEMFNIYYEKPLWIFLCSIGLFVLYFFLYAFLISITIRWYTIISSIETRRNEKCLKKTINFQAQGYSETSQSITYAFKKIFFDNIYEEDPDNKSFNLSYPNFKKKINYYINRFKGIKQKNDLGEGDQKDDYLLVKENNEIQIKKQPIEFDIKTELPHFLKSCGMELNEEELDFMLHVSGDKKNLMEGKIDDVQLKTIWATINYFCSTPLQDIYRHVFKNYFGRENMEDLERQEARGFNEKKIADFLIYYKEYFNDDLCEFLLDEVKYLGANFSLDAFIFRIIGYGALNTY